MNDWFFALGGVLYLLAGLSIGEARFSWMRHGEYRIAREHKDGSLGPARTISHSRLFNSLGAGLFLVATFVVWVLAA